MAKPQGTAKNILKTVVFLTIGFVIFCGVQNLMIPDSPTTGVESQGRIMDGFDALEENTLDALFVGPSSVFCGVEPMELYENYQIVAYDLASSGQPFEASYYMAKYAFQTQSPKVVFLDVSKAFSDPEGANISEQVDNAMWWILLDQFPFGRFKYEMAQVYAAQPYSDGILAAMFPIIKFHTRWSSLTKDDFKPANSGVNYSGGAFPSSIIEPIDPTLLTLERINLIASEMMRHSEGGYRYVTPEESGEVSVNTLLYSAELPESSIEYIKKLKQLCEDHDSQLVLFKVPTLNYPQVHVRTWTQIRLEKIKSLANELGLAFYDFEYDRNIIDFTQDTLDSGTHLNLQGGIKVSAELGKILRDTYHLGPHEDGLYDDSLVKYHKMRETIFLEMETDYNSYIQKLADNLDKWTVFISACEDYTTGMGAEDYANLEQKLGLQLISDSNYCDSYCAVINRDGVIYEALGDRQITHFLEVENVPVSLTSSGWYSYAKVSIKIKGTEYAPYRVGLSFVVYDNESGCVIDSVAFDTRRDNKPATRNWSTVNYTYFRNYESKVCYGEDAA